MGCAMIGAPLAALECGALVRSTNASGCAMGNLCFVDRRWRIASLTWKSSDTTSSLAHTENRTALSMNRLCDG